MNDDRPVILPPPVVPGDCIGLFSPSGPVRDRERFAAGRQLLHDLGFRTKQYSCKATDVDYLAADDNSRTDEFLALWNDSEVKAMMAVRGGYGCLRMVPYLDPESLRKAPKRVVGFSDLTVLINMLADRAGIISFHGPVLTTLAGSDQPSIDSFVTNFSGNSRSTRKFESVEVLRQGTASGILRGGNLTTLAHLLGTPWEIPFKGSLLLLEDTGEPMYRIDRILTQLYISGRLEHLSGILLGTFDYRSEAGTGVRLQEELWNRVLELTAKSGCPVWGNFPIGHLRENHTFPIGATATMDSAAASLAIEVKQTQIQQYRNNT